jgi:hypothetical protein
MPDIIPMAEHHRYGTLGELCAVGGAATRQVGASICRNSRRVCLRAIAQMLQPWQQGSPEPDAEHHDLLQRMQAGQPQLSQHLRGLAALLAA